MSMMNVPDIAIELTVTDASPWIMNRPCTVKLAEELPIAQVLEAAWARVRLAPPEITRVPNGNDEVESIVAPGLTRNCAFADKVSAVDALVKMVPSTTIEGETDTVFPETSSVPED